MRGVSKQIDHAAEDRVSEKDLVPIKKDQQEEPKQEQSGHPPEMARPCQAARQLKSDSDSKEQ